MISTNPLNKDKKHMPKTNGEEPKSAHSTPIVEKYIKKRNTKAKQQIQHEENGNAGAIY